MAKKHKSRSKKTRRPVVKGPQLGLKLGKAKGEPPRTARMRFVEAPKWKDGNPFFAVRVPGEVLAAFRKEAKKKDTTAGEMVRAYMSKVTGVVIGGEDE